MRALRIPSERTRAALLAVVLLASYGCGGDSSTAPSIPGDPTSISVEAGHGQSSPAGAVTPIPLSAIVKDAAGIPVPGVSVIFTLVDGPSSQTIRSVMTGADGIARLVDWTPPPALGLHAVQARTGNLYCMFGVTTVLGAPASMTVVSGSGLKRQTDAEIAVSVAIRDLGGNAIPGATVTFSVGASGGTVANGVQTTNSAGVASIAQWRLGSSVGVYTLDATSGSLKAVITAFAVSGPPASISRLAGDGQRVTAGGRLREPVTVFVADAEGRGVPFVPVTWKMPVGNGAVLSCGPQPTDDAGIGECGRFTWLLPQPGVYTLTATAGALSSTFTETALAVPATIVFSSAPDSATEVHTGSFVASELTVLVRFVDGSPAVGYPVSFRSAFDAAVSDSTAITDANGRAGTRWRITYQVGRATLNASLDGVLTAATSVSAFGPILFEELSAGDSHTCGIGARIIYCWGSNAAGQIGDGQSESTRLVPVKVPFTPKGTLSTQSVGDHSCLWDEQSSGKYSKFAERYCWGRGPDGTQLFRTPTKVGLLSYAVADFMVASIGWRVDGATHACVLTTDGAAWCGGRNDAGQLGDGSTIDRSTATQVVGGLTFRSLVVGGGHTCGITLAGTSYCWGRNDAGQLGDGSTTARSGPTLVAGGVAFARLSAGGAHTCGVASTGEAYCWGANTYGQLGIGTNDAKATTPQPVSGALRFGPIAAGATHTCGSLAGPLPATNAYCWGRNHMGQLGDGTTIDRQRPTAVADFHP